MDRRRWILNAGAALCVSQLDFAKSLARTKPNILILLTDQQSADAAGYVAGNGYLHTPNMDWIASRGRIFTRAYCANPLCVPSRSSMFTGQYPSVSGIMTNTDIKAPERLAKYKTLGAIFQEAGYDTGYFGKWHLPIPAEATSHHGFSTIETRPVDFQTASAASEFIKESKSPFLAFVSILNPHNICEWARGQRLSLGPIGTPPAPELCPPLRPNHAQQHNEPPIMTRLKRSYQSSPMFPVGDFTEDKWRQYEWAYYRLIEKADEQIGVVLNALRAAGKADDTVIVLLSDHGDCQGAHGWNQKTVFYEEATRVPFIVSWPSYIRQGRSERLVNTGIDLIPTLCDVAGIRPPAHLPGESVIDNLPSERKFVVSANRFIQGASVDGNVPTATGRMLRSTRYKYCVYSEGGSRESLVDLQNDPGEMVNLVGNERFEGVLKDHRKMLQEWCRKTGDTFAFV